MGSTVGRIKANDGDEGENAKMRYRIVEGDGKDSLDIITDEITQEGIIVVKKVTLETLTACFLFLVVLIMIIVSSYDHLPYFPEYYIFFLL